MRDLEKPGAKHDKSAAGPLCVVRLKDRADFLRVASGGRVHMRGFSLQFLKNAGDGVRLGFTVTKKVGNAVMRNRVRRRLKEAARISFAQTGAQTGLAGMDYVLVGRLDAASLPFPSLIADLKQALARAHTAKPPRKPKTRDEGAKASGE